MYIDFINELEGVTCNKKEELIRKVTKWKNNVSFRELEKVNNQIEETIDKDTNELYANRIKSYDKDYIRYVLSYQEKHNLSNIKLSQKFKLSRTTIAKWKKQFNVNS